MPALRLFEIAPDLQELWGFDRYANVSIQKNSNHYQTYVGKGVALIMGVDKAVDFLGPNLEPLQDSLFELGRQHIHMKAEPEFWPLVGDALFYTLEQGLGDQLTPRIRKSWYIIYDYMAYWMIEGLLAEEKDRCLVEEEETAKSAAVVQQPKNKGFVLDPNRKLMNLYRPTPIEKINFNTVHKVLNSWETVVRIPDWQSKSGEIVLKKLFELIPQLKTAWGFSEDFDPNDLSDPSQNRFKKKGLGFMTGVDKAVAYLGPDLEPLEVELFELGRLHVHMAAEPEYWEPVGEALIYTLEQVLGNEFTEEVKYSWMVIYDFLAYHMVNGLIAERTGR